MHVINAYYRILDVFEKNPLQSMMLGSSHENPEDIVVINEVIWSPLFTREVAESIFAGFINLITHSEDEVSCQLVTAYHKGMPISKYLSSRTLPFRNRINLCYEFLKTIVSYNEFPPWIQDILIDEDQIIIWEDQLLYNELLILKTNKNDYVETINFTKVRKKIHKIISMLIGDSLDASPALLSFLERLKNSTSESDTLHKIYDDFQKVFLYDYYLNQDDAIQAAPSVIPVPFIITDENNDVVTDEEPESITTEQNETNPLEYGPPEEDNAENAEANTMLPQTELDAVDADMEKNLELFFNRDRNQQENPDENEENPKKFKNWLWILLGIAGFCLIVWAGSQFFMSNKPPVAAYTSTLKDSVWHLQNTSTFSDKAAFKRCEWTVYQNGELIDLYDDYDLTLALEETGIYQVVLRVMDSDGNWSNIYQTSLENSPVAGDPANSQAGAVPLSAVSAEEKMDKFIFKFTSDRTYKDSAFFRTGSYSLQVSPGKKPEIIDVQGVGLDKDGMVSIWIASENTDPITLIFTGYNLNNKVFTNEFIHVPLASRQWEMRQFTIEPEKPMNRMTLSVKGNTLINLDDLTIDSYK